MTRRRVKPVRMWRDKPAGVKILWVWTFGTAAVLLASVVRTRIRDMEKLMNADQQQSSAADFVVVDRSLPSDEVVLEEKS